MSVLKHYTVFAIGIHSNFDWMVSYMPHFDPNQSYSGNIVQIKSRLVRDFYNSFKIFL